MIEVITRQSKLSDLSKSDFTIHQKYGCRGCYFKDHNYSCIGKENNLFLSLVSIFGSCISSDHIFILKPKN